ncbi:MAG: DUF4870 domain-containing protein [Planctomycetota bacterium]|nr:DUF4870 domain-containing protein [Planctomycetota bacterium]
MEVDPNPSAQSRQWAMLAHLLTLLGYLVGFGHFLPPLVIWLSKRDEDEFLADQAKESLNFQITFLLAAIVGGVVIVLLYLSCIGIPLAILLGLALPIAHLVFVLIAGLKASDGVRYRYPLTIRFF